MIEQQQLVFITPTWAGDIDHFRVMRTSFEQSQFSGYAHYVVVQDEDLPLFSEFQGRDGLVLLSTKDVLPPAVEHRRHQAKAFASSLGRNVTRICGSLKRVFSRPLWPSYTGWHTQQICKLKLASELPYTTAIIIDSDVIITKSAVIDDFVSSDSTICFSDWLERTKLRGKVKNWINESDHLTNNPKKEPLVNVYFDTPFVINKSLLCKALADLEASSGKPWWNALLDRPPRRWSEFGFYKAFLIKNIGSETIEWREPNFSHYLYDTKNPSAVVKSVSSMLEDSNIHYITIHSQANGREYQDPNTYLNSILSLLSSSE